MQPRIRTFLLARDAHIGAFSVADEFAALLAGLVYDYMRFGIWFRARLTSGVLPVFSRSRNGDFMARLTLFAFCVSFIVTMIAWEVRPIICFAVF
jgi:hypothetical protein